MSNYIKREDAIKVLLRSQAFAAEGSPLREALKMAVRALGDDSFADVVEVKHGHWIKKSKCRPDCPNDSDYQWECSECRMGDIHNENVRVDYCWHCGAKMDAERKDGESE